MLVVMATLLVMRMILVMEFFVQRLMQ